MYINPEPVVSGSQAELVSQAKRQYSHALRNLALYALIGYPLQILAVSLLDSLGYWDRIPASFQFIIQFVPMYLVAFPLYLLISKLLPKSPPEQHRMPKRDIVLAFFMCEGMAVIGSVIGTFVIAVLGMLLGLDFGSTAIQDGITGSGGLVFGIIAAICAPFVEEMLFRKVLIDRIRKYGNGTAILLSGLFFGLFHGNFTQFFYAAMLGMFFAFIYIRTGRVRYTVCLHMMVNSLSTVVAGGLLRLIDLDKIVALTHATLRGPLTSLIFLVSDMLRHKLDLGRLIDVSASEPIRGLIGSAFPLFLLALYMVCFYGMVIGGLILLIASRKQFRVPSPEIPLPEGKQLSTACGNFGFWLMILVCGALFAIHVLL